MSEQQIVQIVKQDLTWFQKHERLLFGLLVSIVLMFGIFKFQDREVILTQARADAATLKAEMTKQQADWNAAATAQIENELQTMIDKVNQQNQALENQNKALLSALEQQKATDAHLGPTDLANRIQTLSGAPVGSIQGNNSGVNMTLPGAVAVTQTLEEVPVLQANLNNEKQIEANKDAELSKGQELIQAQAGQIAGLNDVISANDKQCKADIKAVKAQAAKSKRNWFIGGFIAGIGTRILLHW